MYYWKTHRPVVGGRENGAALLWERVTEWLCSFIVCKPGEKEAVPVTEQLRDIKDNLEHLALSSLVSCLNPLY